MARVLNNLPLQFYWKNNDIFSVPHTYFRYIYILKNFLKKTTNDLPRQVKCHSVNVGIKDNSISDWSLAVNCTTFSSSIHKVFQCLPETRDWTQLLTESEICLPWSCFFVVPPNALQLLFVGYVILSVARMIFRKQSSEEKCSEKILDKVGGIAWEQQIK